MSPGLVALYRLSPPGRRYRAARARAIFGLGAKADIFSPENGLFLDEEILDQGLIAIVPDVDLQPKDKDLPHADLAERNQRLRDWEKASTKEYKVVVLDLDNKLVHVPRLLDDS